MENPGDEYAHRSKVTIIAGFLGSGKTTMIERLIKQKTLKSKIAIIQNEFSQDMGIEAPLMTTADGEVLDAFYEMPNGCICWTVKDDLVSTLELLVENKPEIEHIFVETNGLADPANIIKIFWLDDGLISNLEYNYTMGVIDAKHFSSNISNQELSSALTKQLVHADKVLINKIDLVDNNTVEEIESEIKKFNPLVEIKHTEFANADLDYLLEAPKRLKNFKDVYEDEIIIENEGDSIHTHTAHSHDIKPYYIKIQGIMNNDKVEQLMGILHWESDITLLRWKGLYIARSEDNDSCIQYMLQGVDDTFEWRLLTEDFKKSQDDISQSKEVDLLDFTNKFLFVGKDIDIDDITEKLKKWCY